MTLFLLVYFGLAIWLACYGINCHVLTRLYREHGPAHRDRLNARIETFYGGRDPMAACSDLARDLPRVTTQLPIFNERHVARRVIDAAAAMVYPDGKHEIQVLDDSTDDTRDMVARRVDRLRSRGVNIVHLTRARNKGYKAGALRQGLAQARGEFTAIFDADFVPPRDFLLKAMPCFSHHPEIGFVQGRWGHLNRRESLVTHLQSIGINGHFMVEQTARNSSGLFLNFNGTAGVFRNQAIRAAGNWQADTLTEDMDLSYRIQLAGWEGLYAPDLVVPAEIPANINDFKSQQFRWAKGSIQTAIKLMPPILHAPVSRGRKIQALLHMTHYLIHPLMLALALLSVPILLSGRFAPAMLAIFLFGLILAAGTSGPSTLYLTAEKSLGRPFYKTLALLPLMMCFGCGLAVSNSRAVWEAVIGRPSAFVRTPKKGDRPQAAGNYRLSASRIYILEWFMGLWCLLATGVYFNAQHYLVGHFLLIYGIGFMSIGTLSWAHQRP